MSNSVVVREKVSIWLFGREVLFEFDLMDARVVVRCHCNKIVWQFFSLYQVLNLLNIVFLFMQRSDQKIPTNEGIDWIRTNSFWVRKRGASAFLRIACCRGICPRAIAIA